MTDTMTSQNIDPSSWDILYNGFVSRSPCRGYHMVDIITERRRARFMAMIPGMEQQKTTSPIYDIDL